ncbi:protein DESIGUAL 2-like [Phragmites australis]|uniref:protein DESIGUAL 2-like n=1 Tax=Phragmites australis TaxID=29695 RepID=UPI002D776233|nr:protein DESIGUAL 2-like [Phragmites australis]
MARVRAAIVVFIVISALDVTAGMLAIQAQAAENKTKKVAIIFIQCKGPVYKAYQLGLAAAGLLVLAHAISNFLGGCACLYSQLESINRKLAVLSWITFGAALSLLLAGAMSNTKSKTSCGFMHFDTLALSGNMCFVHGVIAVAYYLTATAAAPEFA